jgi:peptide/nickel transport system substrate-binding protein
MRRSAWRFVALISLTGLAARAPAETRPHYGGTFTVEIHDAITLADPAGWPVPLVPLVYDTLVRLDDRGEVRPALAVLWQHDAESKRWEFRLRDGAKFHDGTPVTAAAVVANLKDWSDAAVSTSGDKLVMIEMRNPAPDLPRWLADARHVILRRGADGVTVGTGPFRIVEWQPGRRARLQANDDYWGGRPFLDAIELQMARGLRDQSIDLEVGKADVVELSIEDARREAERGVRTWASAPSDLLALVFEPGRAAVEDPRVRSAVALSIDRAAIHGVLLEKQGESTGALLPQWITGYAFLFPGTRDLERARQSAAALPRGAPRLSLAYDAADPVARPIAERIALNAREAGVVIQVAPDGKADMRLARVHLRSLEPAQALADLAAAFHLGELIEPAAQTAEARYQVERKVLEAFRVAPLVHLPEILGIGPRVRNWEPVRWGNWCLDNVWLAARTP